MNTAFPLIAIAVAIVALALSPPSERQTKKPLFIAPIAILVILGLAGFLYKSDYPDLLPAVLAGGAGVMAAVFCRILDRWKDPSGATAAGIAAGLAGLTTWVGATAVSATTSTSVENTPHNFQGIVQLALVFGLSIGAWTVDDFQKTGKSGLATATAILGAVFVAANFMGREALDTETAGLTGTLLGLSLAIAGVIGLALNRSEKKATATPAFIPGWAMIMVLLILGYVVGGRLLSSVEAFLIFDGSVICAAIVHWIVRPQGLSDSFSALISTVVWIGVATLAFSYEKGFGMAIASAGAASTLIALGNQRALLTAGPLIALTFYRVLREAQPDAAKALDIGQHYAVIGIAFGAGLAILPREWIANRLESAAKNEIGRFLWAIILGLAPVGLAVVLGAKGMVGLVAGLGFASFVEVLRGESSAIPVLLTGGIGSLVVVAYPWLTQLLDMTRESKQIAFYWIVGVTLVIAALLAGVSRPDVETESK
jgi:hypothetical protein